VGRLGYKEKMVQDHEFVKTALNGGL